MPPKAKAKTPKQIITELETELKTTKEAKVSREKALLDTNFSLIDTVNQLRELCAKQQKEFDVQHEVKLREKSVELESTKARAAELGSRVIALTSSSASVRTLQEERVVLLRQVSEVTQQRDEAEMQHAEEVHALQNLIDNTKSRLEKVFNETLRTAVADEKKRLAMQLDAEATAALAEVGQLRLLASTQARQISQLMKVVDDAHREGDKARRNAEETTTLLITEQAKNIGAIESRAGVLRANEVANKWSALAIELHGDVSELRSRLGLPPIPPPRVDAHAVAHVRRGSAEGPLARAEAASTSAGHVRPSTARLAGAARAGASADQQYMGSWHGSTGLTSEVAMGGAAVEDDPLQKGTVLGGDDADIAAAATRDERDARKVARPSSSSASRPSSARGTTIHTCYVTPPVTTAFALLGVPVRREASPSPPPSASQAQTHTPVPPPARLFSPTWGIPMGVTLSHEHAVARASDDFPGDALRKVEAAERAAIEEHIRMMSHTASGAGMVSPSRPTSARTRVAGGLNRANAPDDLAVGVGIRWSPAAQRAGSRSAVVTGLPMSPSPSRPATASPSGHPVRPSTAASATGRRPGSARVGQLEFAVVGKHLSTTGLGTPG